LHRHTQKFIMRLQEQARDHGGIVDMTTWTSCLTIDLISDLAFSEDFGRLDAGALRPRLQTLFASIKQFTFLKEVLRLPWLLAKIVTAGLSAVMMWRGVTVDEVGANVLAKRRTGSEQAGPDFVSYMLRRVDAKGTGHVRCAPASDLCC
jgi:cytochrome P450